MSSPRLCSALLVLLLSPIVAGCSLFSDSSSSTSPTPTGSMTEVFSGTLAQKSSNFYTFTVAQSGPVSVMLTSVGSSSTMAVGLGLGTPSGTTCSTTSSSPTAVAGTTAQISVTENPGTYCVQITDVGNLTAAATFSITIVHS